MSIAGANTCTDVWGPGADKWDHTRWLESADMDPDRTRFREEGPKIVITDEQGRLVEECAGGGSGGERSGTEHGEVGKGTNFAGTQVTRAKLPGVFAGM